MYKPPFEITNKMLTLSISITEKVGKINSFNSLKRMPILRRNNKIKSIHSSLAIEANSLSLNQVKDVIEGKVVLGPLKEIQEVKNAYNAYSNITNFDGYSEQDLLKAHFLLTNSVCDLPGKYRNHGEGVFDGSKVIFVAPPHDLVPSLMKDLFKWLKNVNILPKIILL
jgi:Fic family protein